MEISGCFPFGLFGVEMWPSQVFDKAVLEILVVMLVIFCAKFITNIFITCLMTRQCLMSHKTDVCRMLLITSSGLERTSAFCSLRSLQFSNANNCFKPLRGRAVNWLHLAIQV